MPNTDEPLLDNLRSVTSLFRLGLPPMEKMYHENEYAITVPDNALTPSPFDISHVVFGNTERTLGDSRTHISRWLNAYNTILLTVKFDDDVLDFIETYFQFELAELRISTKNLYSNKDRACHNTARRRYEQLFPESFTSVSYDAVVTFKALAISVCQKETLEERTAARDDLTNLMHRTGANKTRIIQQFALENLSHLYMLRHAVKVGEPLPLLMRRQTNHIASPGVRDERAWLLRHSDHKNSSSTIFSIDSLSYKNDWHPVLAIEGIQTTSRKEHTYNGVYSALHDNAPFSTPRKSIDCRHPILLQEIRTAVSGASTKAVMKILRSETYGGLPRGSAKKVVDEAMSPHEPLSIGVCLRTNEWRSEPGGALKQPGNNTSTSVRMKNISERLKRDIEKTKSVQENARVILEQAATLCGAAMKVDTAAEARDVVTNTLDAKLKTHLSPLLPESWGVTGAASAVEFAYQITENTGTGTTAQEIFAESTVEQAYFDEVYPVLKVVLDTAARRFKAFKCETHPLIKGLGEDQRYGSVALDKESGILWHHKSVTADVLERNTLLGTLPDTKKKQKQKLRLYKGEWFVNPDAIERFEQWRKANFKDAGFHEPKFDPETGERLVAP